MPERQFTLSGPKLRVSPFPASARGRHAAGGVLNAMRTSPVLAAKSLGEAGGAMVNALITRMIQHAWARRWTSFGGSRARSRSAWTWSRFGSSTRANPFGRESLCLRCFDTRFPHLRPELAAPLLAAFTASR